MFKITSAQKNWNIRCLMVKVNYIFVYRTVDIILKNLKRLMIIIVGITKLKNKHESHKKFGVKNAIKIIWIWGNINSVFIRPNNIFAVDLNIRTTAVINNINEIYIIINEKINFNVNFVIVFLKVIKIWSITKILILVH